MQYCWSKFCIFEQTGDIVIVKNNLTSAVVKLRKDFFERINKWIAGSILSMPANIESLLGDNAILVSTAMDEFESYQKSFLDTRNEKAFLFTLHLLPTLKCQLFCDYCVEKGIIRAQDLNENVLAQTVRWLVTYFKSDFAKEVSMLKLVFFGGEPLLRQNTIKDSLISFSKLADQTGKNFIVELITNGTLLDKNTAGLFKSYNWKRVQITLDGPERIHNSRRYGQNKKGTFAEIIRNVTKLLDLGCVEKINIRISIDLENADYVPELLLFLASLGWQDKIQLTLGLITSNLAGRRVKYAAEIMADKMLSVWQSAQELGFKIPDEFIAGPWCVAIAKHSAVIEPSGSLQKCFCMVGRSEYSFGNIMDTPSEYARDERFEHCRIGRCIKE